MSTGSSSRHALDVRGWSTRRKLFLAAKVAVVLIVLSLLVLRFGDDSSDATVQQESLTTTEITKQDLVDTETVVGNLEFGDSVDLTTGKSGTVTQTAAAGKTVKRNGVLWRVDQSPTILMYGHVPAYRNLEVGSNGSDVRQLENNLKKLGYSGFTTDKDYTSNTADAVARWQEDVGISATGVLTLGQVIFRPGSVRVASEIAAVGSLVQPGARVLIVTGTQRIVAIDLDTADQSLASVKDKVVVTLPDGQDVNGRITSVGTIATASVTAEGPGADSQSSDATIPVTVELDKPSKAKQWDSAPVDVALEADRVKDVLTVPVTALLALAEGGYAVEVVSGTDVRQLVAVQTGLFADGRVEVSGEGISEGTVVVVPTT